ncbi:ParB N-terminal domain-containing protein [Jinshanibacter sp. LJY008]|uniref:ParB N-terminal domain-containing protein n=1 Tax=Limnobaculum eriocheiris TaxID=2897391 RepID=A0A9X1SNC9_9GAMM|nr:ParB N-terminal domain-containing protein [Limnobaculum eriocheiris]MCD1124822.1 ParB N-terminal domain-containing protein [Limnobaculum eriocheiris]
MAIETEVKKVNLRELRILEKNAHFMEPAMFARLVDNIKRDGKLTSFPVVYQNEVLSGNHRTQAAIKAGIEEDYIINITSELTEDEKLAIQLSHNSINGKDDNNILKELYNSINSMDMKLYSGLTDDSFKMEEINVESLSFVQPSYEDMLIAFLPEDRIAFMEGIEKITKKAKDKLVMTANISDFDLIYKAVITTKSKLNILNTAEAFKAMATLALQKLEEEEKEDGEATT